ncbi:MAG TPA: glycosyltransferase family 4 protein [Vicinamibacterales bacterium]|nr:glycosyltransferase family 4 protein [Vicinamibacterales bacterium]
MRHVVVMVTTSYPRFPGDSVGTFMEPIAKSVAALGHAVHVVAPWHPRITRGSSEDGVSFHFYRYAPVPALNVFGYASALRADVRLKGAALAAAPLALAAGWRAVRRVIRESRATIVHAHWVIPGGAIAAAAARRLPLVVSLHGSDVFVAETFAPARRAARLVFARAGAITACSADLASRAIALGADAGRVEVIPYGVDVERFRPDRAARSRLRGQLPADEGATVVFAAGRLVRKKGFEYLIEAVGRLPPSARTILVIAGHGDLGEELHQRAEVAARGRVTFLGDQPQDAVAAWMSAADVVAVPSVRDEAGNVDGLPNVVLEALASGTPVVTTAAGGIGSVVEDGRTALVVAERDPAALAAALSRLAGDAGLRRRLSASARIVAAERFGWAGAARRFDAAYAAALALKSGRN